MKREDIDRLLERNDFIPGIYNYCDRWCERCPQTSRCLNFVMAGEHFGDSERCDLTNEIFWQKLDEMFSLALEMVRETARKMGIDLDALVDDIDMTGPKPGDEIIHLVSHLAKSYAEQVDAWFSGNAREIESVPARPPLRLLGQDIRKEEIAAADALEVIRWYQHQIYVKICRALDSNDDEPVDQFPRVADGSAKVALIGIDRSISAWGVLLKLIPGNGPEITPLIRLLQRLRQRIISEFPGAPGFVRPGFDLQSY